MSLLVIGGTGTLGRQIVRKALNDGFQVKCLVRNFRKSAFLKEWGAELVYGDLTIPETIPKALNGVTSVIDSSTTRINNYYEINQVDLKAKYILIESAIKARVKRYIFFSIFNSYNYTNVPLIKLKLLIEKRLKKSPINYTVFSLSGFFQGLISQYAVPILDEYSIWITNEVLSISYMNTQDIAKIAIKSLSVNQFNNKILSLSDNKSWTSLQIITLCEKISGRRAKINIVPIIFLNFLMFITKFFQWTWTISSRLAFIKLLSYQSNSYSSLKEILYILKMEPNEIESLELYFQEYFHKIMKKLKELNYDSLNMNNDINKLDF
uniref:NmrA-like domain-containing protein n=1 Tax=Sonderella linearis TaxID=110477 RepID=A0A1Z1MLP3_9FLOR|nr:hypothetical protein [Sonderella linearis]ARW67020.1 hypothetical protein [Sonderella linearis]